MFKRSTIVGQLWMEVEWFIWRFCKDRGGVAFALSLIVNTLGRDITPLAGLCAGYLLHGGKIVSGGLCLWNEVRRWNDANKMSSVMQEAGFYEVHPSFEKFIENGH